MWPISFLLPDPLPPNVSDLLPLATFAGGYDQTPVPTRIEILGDRLVASRSLQESGPLLLPWPIDGVGVVVTSTATIRERPEPYNLLVELARGKLNQVRCQSAEWVEMGLQLPPEFETQLSALVRQFGQAILVQDTPEAAPIASGVLHQSHLLASQLVEIYIEQLFATREHEEGGKIATRFAARLPSGPQPGLADAYLSSFNATQVAFRWRDIEPHETRYNWTTTDQAVANAVNAGLSVSGGPIIDLTPGVLPDWAMACRGDLLTLSSFMCDYLETVIRRYRNHVRRWVVCAGANQSDALGLSDDDRFRLVARLFEAAMEIDPKLELVLSMAQPWGDYLAHGDQTISPLVFADDLSRLGIRLSAVELELRAGTTPRGSLPRDLLETSRLLDLFSVLGLPLEVVLSYPSSATPDANAAAGQEVWPLVQSTPEQQAAWGAGMAMLALCKPQVQAVTWDHWSDADPHLIPTSGLIDATGKEKPLLALLRALRDVRLAPLTPTTS